MCRMPDGPDSLYILFCLHCSNNTKLLPTYASKLNGKEFVATTYLKHFFNQSFTFQVLNCSHAEIQFDINSFWFDNYCHFGSTQMDQWLLRDSITQLPMNVINPDLYLTCSCQNNYYGHFTVTEKRNGTGGSYYPQNIRSHT